MKHTPQHILLLAFATVMTLVGCNDSFTGAITESYDRDHPSTNSEVNPVKEKVYITPSVTDPLYSLILDGGATTRADGDRGAGPFDGWDAAADKWRNARMHVFAFRADNHVAQGVQSYVQSSFNDDCLLWNEPAHVVDNGILQFYAQNKIYNMQHQDYRYKFYLSHVDNASTPGVRTEGKKLKQDITINGTQDVMVGFAFHTDDEINKHIEDLVRHGYATDKETHVLATFKQGMTYSTIAGHRALHPKFHLRHLMTRFSVQIVGRYSASSPTLPAYRNVIITGIEIQSPDGGTMMVANDDWDENFNFLPHTALFVPNKNMVFHPSLIYKQEFNEKTIQDLKPADAQRDRQDLLDIMQQYGYLLNEPVWQCNSRQPLTICEDFLLPQQERYTLKLHYYYVDRIPDGKGGYLPEVASPESIYDFATGPLASTYTIEPNAASGINHFEMGKKYILQLYVYGLEKIRLNVSELDLWDDGGTIPLEPEE